MPDPYDVAMARKSLQQDADEEAIVQAALKKRKRKVKKQPTRTKQSMFAWYSDNNKENGAMASVNRSAYFPKLAAMAKTIPCRVNAQYGKDAAPDFKPSVRMDTGNGWTDSKKRQKRAGWQGLMYKEAKLPLPALLGLLGAGVGGLGGAAYGALAPGEDAEGKKRNRWLNALGMGLLGAGVGGGAGMGGGALAQLFGGGRAPTEKDIANNKLIEEQQNLPFAEDKTPPPTLGKHGLPDIVNSSRNVASGAKLPDVTNSAVGASAESRGRDGGFTTPGAGRRPPLDSASSRSDAKLLRDISEVPPWYGESADAMRHKDPSDVANWRFMLNLEEAANAARAGNSLPSRDPAWSLEDLPEELRNLDSPPPNVLDTQPGV